jgi:ankyrin repeat protein
LDAKRTTLQHELEALTFSIRILQPMVSLLEERDAGYIDSFSVLHDALQRESYDATSVAPHLENPLLDINKEDEQGKTLLHLAIEQGNVPLSRSLIQKGAEVNVRDREGKTPIQYAIDKDDQAAILLLEASGADQDLPPDWQLQGSYDARSQELTLSISNAAEGPQQAPWRITNVTWSHGISGHIPSSISLHYGENRIPLTVEVATLTEPPYLQILVQGPDNAYQATTLDLKETCIAQLEAITPQEEEARIYVEKIKNSLEDARRIGDSDINNRRCKRTELETLLNQSNYFQENYQDKLDVLQKNLTMLPKTPGLSRGSQQAIEEVTNKNISCKKLNDDLQEWKQALVAKIQALKSQIGPSDPTRVLFKMIKQGCQEGDIDIYLKNPNKDWSLLNEEGETLLQAAIKHRNNYATQQLLEHGTDVNVVNTDGETPLQTAIGCRNNYAIQQLLAHGSNVNSRVLTTAHRRIDSF